MSIKRLQRYRTNNAPAVATDDGCWVADYAVTELEATNAELVKALENLIFSSQNNTGHEPSLSCYQRDLDDAESALASAKGE